MNTPHLTSRTRPAAAIPAGFTLVEMLVVIGIIAALVAITVPVVMQARVSARNAAIVVEVGQLDMALKQYKGDKGEYPPDCAGLQSPNLTLRAAAQAAVLRHFATAFPQYVPGVPSGSTSTTAWGRFADDAWASWHVHVDNLSPSTSLIFFLGGAPDWFLDSSNNPILPGNTTPPFDPNKPVRGFLGFSANRSNPFDYSPTRTHPFYDFDIASVGWIAPAINRAGFAYWAKDQGVTDKTTGPIIYFRAENGNYTMDGNPMSPNDPTDLSHSNFKYEGSITSTPPEFVAPAVDTRYSNFSGMYNYSNGRAVVYTWVNPQSFQIFASGLDLRYATPFIGGTTSNYVDCTCYPTGESYRLDPNTNGNAFHAITNFSNGTLEAAMKAAAP